MIWEENNLFFLDINQYFGKIKCLGAAREEIYEPGLLSSKYLKNIN